MAEVMRLAQGRRIFAGGLAYQYCVGWTLINLADEGFEVYLVKDCTRAVGGPDGPEVADMKNFFKAMNIKEVSLNDIVE